MTAGNKNSRLIAMVVAGQAILTAIILGILFWTSRTEEASPPESFFSSPAPSSESTFRANAGRTGFFDSHAIREVGEVDTRLETISVFTAPVMADGVIYLGKGGNNLTAIEIDTGRELWQRKVLEWQASVPAVSGGTIFFGAEAFYALDARTGAEKWRFDVKAQGETGFVNAPLIVSDTVFVSRKDRLYALDALTGAKRWEYAIDGNLIETTAPAFSGGTLFFGGGSAVNGSREHALYAVDPATGGEKWRYKLTGKISSPPAAVDGAVYFTASEINQTGGGDPRFPSQVSITSSVHAVDAATGSEIWRFNTDRSIEQPPAVAGGLVFFSDSRDIDFGGSSQGSLHALDAGTGKEVWTIDAGRMICAPSVAEDWLYIAAAYPDPPSPGSGNGRIALLALDTRTGQEKWHYDFNQGYSMPSPVFYRDVMYVAPAGLLAFKQAAGI